MDNLYHFLNNTFANTAIMFFVLGVILFLLGIALVSMTIYISVAGYRVSGKVIGVVQDVWTRQKSRNGKSVTKTTTMLYAIYEYVRPDGTLHREKSSNGGDGVLKYRTGQAVELLVIPNDRYDDVYNANDQSSWFIAFVFLVAGMVIMFLAANFLASLSIGLISIFAFLFGLLYKIFIGRNRERTKTKQNRYSKAFSLSEIKPVEYFKGK